MWWISAQASKWNKELNAQNLNEHCTVQIWIPNTWLLEMSEIRTHGHSEFKWCIIWMPNAIAILKLFYAFFRFQATIWKLDPLSADFEWHHLESEQNGCHLFGFQMAIGIPNVFGFQIPTVLVLCISYLFFHSMLLSRTHPTKCYTF
jgi:hypothetical protein